MGASRTRSFVIVISAVLVAGATATWWFRARHGARPNSQPVPKYVGDRSCRECHVAIVDAYQRNAMHQTWQPLTAANTVEDFERSSHVYDAKRDLHYEVLARDGNYYQREYRSDGDGNVTHELLRTISRVIGSGEHARGYVSDDNGYLNEMPIWWFREKADWDLGPTTSVYNYRFERPLTAGCVSCHTDSKRNVEGTFNFYESVAADGIGCERCHGPAEWHVRQQREGWEPPQNGPGLTMFVNPARLSADRQNDICFQCHLMGDAQFPFPDQDQFAFRPGLRLSDFRCDYFEKSSDPERFGIVSHAARMVQSRCYTESRGTFTCMTCHDPHKASKEIAAETNRQKCLNCHAPTACNRVADATAADRQDDCIHCHMPRGEPSFVEHTVYTDHWIRRPQNAAVAGAAESSQAPPTMVDFWDDGRWKDEREGIAHIAFAIFKGNRANLDRGVEILSSTATRGQLHREGWRRFGMGALLQGNTRRAVSAFERGTAAYPDDAALRMGLGSALRSIGDRRRALGELMRANELAPAMLEPYLEAASVHVELQQPEKARDLLEQSLARYPYQASALTMLGMIYLQFLRDVPRGLELLNQSNRLDPDNLSLRLTLGMALIEQNELDAARVHLREALRIAPEDVSTLLVMARLHVAREETTEAIDRLQQVLKIDPKNTQARAVLDELRRSGHLDREQSGTNER
jgi:tetratricopeptide (TPR) repeat protein